jgi:acetylornithine deacetylase/succinyl-diaminopimelate desuccinylase-like protein
LHGAARGSLPAVLKARAQLSRSLEMVTGRKPSVCGGPRHDAYMLILYGGVPTVACGAGDVMHGRGTAHEPDECIDIDGELIPYVEALALAILEWCGYSI